MADIKIEEPAAGAVAAKPKRRNLSWLWQALGVALALFVIEQDFEYALRTAGLHPGTGALGIRWHAPAGLPPGDLQAGAIIEGGPMAEAGVRPGDLVHLDIANTWLRPLHEGEIVGFTLQRAGVERHVEVTARPAAAFNPSDPNKVAFNLLLGLSNILPAIVGAFIIWRSGGRGAALYLGLALVGYAKVVPAPELWLTTPDTFPWLLGLGFLLATSSGFFFLAFPMQFYSETVGPLPRWRWWVLVGFLLLGTLLIIPANLTFYLTLRSLPVVGYGTALFTFAVIATMLASLFIMIQGWRRAPPAAQKRYALMLVAFGAIIVVQGIYSVFGFLNEDLLDPRNPMSWLSMAIQGVLAPGLFAYAILRHKVFDLGFAINRTLVYGVVSAILLLAFGLSEWALDKLVKIESRETNALLDAGLALAVFLTFHHVQSAVEHVIERLFFRRWHEKEAALKTFGRQAGFVLRADALARAFVDELKRFCDGADAALYLRNESGDFVLSEGQLSGGPATINADDPLLVTLRADRGAADIDETRSTLPAALGLPMIHRVELTGFVLLGDKPGGLGYRPDEKAILAATTLQVGLDLHALKVEQLEQRVVSLEARNGELHAALDRRAAAQ